MKKWPSRLMRTFRLGYKRLCVRIVSCLGSRSYPLFGVPSGLTTVEDVQELIPGEKVELPLPKSVEEKMHWRYEQGREIEIPAQGIFHLKDALATHLGGNLNHRGRLITTYLVPIDGKTAANHDLFAFTSKRFFPRILEAERVISLTAGWQDMFYHWMYEILPRLSLVKEMQGKLYIDVSKRFQKESLEFFGIDTADVIDASKWEGVRAKELIVPSIPRFPSTWVCQFLKKHLPLQKRKQEKIYISRSDADKRRIVNEEELDPILEKHGFRKVVMSSLPFLEQATLFFNAEMVVGPHGAGFSHLAFCKKKTAVLEIFAKAYTHLCYWQISNSAQLDYHYMFGEGKLAPISHQISDNSHTLSPQLASQGDGAVLSKHCPHPPERQAVATEERFVQRFGEKWGRGNDPDIEVDPKKFEKALMHALANR